MRYIPDGTEVRLNDGATGLVYHDQGGQNVPVRLTGKNTSGLPHDYTPVPRAQVTPLRGPNPHAQLTFRRNGGCNGHGCCETFWAECGDCGGQYIFEQFDTDGDEVDRWRTTHLCTGAPLEATRD